MYSKIVVMKRLQVEGQVFGRLIAVEFSGIGKFKYAMWRCLCECGKEVVVAGHRLVSGVTKSCGCLQGDHMRTIPRASRMKNLALAVKANRRPDASFRDLFRHYRSNAKIRNLPWELTSDEFRKITLSRCYYTGREPASSWKSAFEDYIYNGIDRLDNSKGYTVENCVPCCTEVNRMKMDSSFDQFINTCAVVAARFKATAREDAAA